MVEKILVHFGYPVHAIPVYRFFRVINDIVVSTQVEILGSSSDYGNEVHDTCCICHIFCDSHILLSTRNE